MAGFSDLPEELVFKILALLPVDLLLRFNDYKSHGIVYFGWL